MTSNYKINEKGNETKEEQCRGQTFWGASFRLLRSSELQHAVGVAVRPSSGIRGFSNAKTPATSQSSYPKIKP